MRPAPVFVRWTSALAAAVAAPSFAAGADAPTRISGPHSHANLAVYLLHGPSVPGPTPATLAEALRSESVRLHETGSVTNLQIENLGNTAVFIQAGDIVKGGQQDRVLTVSLLLPAKSGKVDIGSFCVEQGRWAARGSENVKLFTSSAEALPSRTAKLAMAAPLAERDAVTPGSRPAGLTNNRTTGEVPVQQRITAGIRPGADKQQKVWEEVSNIQRGLAEKLRSDVKSAASASSLQLTLEHERLKTARTGYQSALSRVVDGQSDVIGFAVAIDGKLVSADVYPSTGLFAKMWEKGLAAAITEALTSPQSESVPDKQPDAAAVLTFITAGQDGKLHEAKVGELAQKRTRDAATSLDVTTLSATGQLLHRNILAK